MLRCSDAVVMLLQQDMAQSLKRDEKAFMKQKLNTGFDFKASILGAQPEDGVLREKVEAMIKASQAQVRADMEVVTKVKIAPKS